MCCSSLAVWVVTYEGSQWTARSDSEKIPRFSRFGIVLVA